MKSPTSPPKSAPPPVQGVHLPVLPPVSAIIEIIVLFGAIIGADWLHPGINIADIRPHPFWIPVLLLSLQYGTVSGLLAASIAIALAALNGFPEQSTSETYFTYFLKIWIEPILWVGAAVLLGQFRMRQIAQKQALFAQVTELANQRAVIADYAMNLRTHCTALERQIAGRSEPDILLVLEALNTIRLADPSGGDTALAEAFARVVALALPGARATLYTVEPAGLRLAATAGSAVAGDSATWIGPADRLYQAIVGEARSVSVLTAEGEHALAGAGLAAVPVRAAARHPSEFGTRTVGMLKIEEIDPSALGRASLPALETIAHALAPALEARLARYGHSGVQATSVAATVVPETAGGRLWRHWRWFGRGQGPSAPARESEPARPKSQVTS